ncbi:MAG: electron transfer flavoprotein subunit alpha/FixB family protein [Bacteroidota bacterium]
MENNIFIFAEHFQGKLTDITFELLGKGRELAGKSGGTLYAVLIGSGVRQLAPELRPADKVLCIEDDRLHDFNPEAYQLVLSELIKKFQPRLTIFGSTSMGLDLAAPLSAKLNIPIISYCRDLRFEDGKLIAKSQLYGGKIFADVELTGDFNIVSVLSGSFRSESETAPNAPQVEDVTASIPFEALRMKFERTIEPEAGDIDITKQDILVSVGRGIQNQDNIAIADELANVLGGAVSASRPVVDQGWLPLTRQVGKSGMNVTPKLYLAAGISGAPEHEEGMKNSGLILAVNTDPNAPIFSIAHYGVCADLLDILPALTEEIKKRKGS